MIFLGAAILYGTAFMLLCRNVKEGEYPPPDTTPGKTRFSLATVKTFFQECFRHRIFRLVFAYSTLQGASASIGVFTIFMVLSLGLTKGDVGKIAGIAGVGSMLLMYPMGALVDRFHPLRVMMAAQVGFCTVSLLKCIFLFHNFPKDTAFWIYATLAGIAIPVSTANSAASMPMLMLLFPREKFGQFCAAKAMGEALGLMIAGVLAGVYLDVLRRIFAESGNYYYRFVPVWSFSFMALAALMTFFVFREWKKRGRIGNDE
jgi:MFS family permease